MQDIGALVFHCPEDGCSKSYSRKKNLQRHMKTAHGIESCNAAGRFICHLSTCGKAFFHARTLKQHYLKHNIQISK